MNIYIYIWNDSPLGCSNLGSRFMPLALPPGVASGGLVAAVVSTLLQEPRFVPPPVLSQDLLIQDSSWHWPSFLAGLLAGLLVAQLIELLYLVRQALSIYIKSRGWGAINAGLVRGRLA